MSKALLGSFADAASLALLDEVRALRARVAELEDALARADEAARLVEQEREIVLEPSTV